MNPCFVADIIEELYSPRTAAMDFVIELVRKRGKDNLQKFILFIVEIFKRYFITFLYSALSMIIRYGPMVL